MPYNPVKDLPSRAFEGDYWDRLMSLINQPVYDWQRKLLFEYLKSPHANLKLSYFTPPELMSGSRAYGGAWAPTKGADVIRQLLGMKTVPGEMPSDVANLFNMGFGRITSEGPRGEIGSTEGFDPTDMLAVIFGGTPERGGEIPYPAQRSAYPAATPNVDPGGLPTNESWDYLKGRLFHEQVGEPLYSQFGGVHPGQYSGPDQWSHLGGEQKSLAFELLETWRKQMAKEAQRYARSDAQRRAESKNLLQGVTGMAMKALPKLMTGGLMPTFKSFKASYLIKNPDATEEEIKKAWMNLQSGQSMFSSAVGAFW